MEVILLVEVHHQEEVILTITILIISKITVILAAITIKLASTIKTALIIKGEDRLGEDQLIHSVLHRAIIHPHQVAHFSEEEDLHLGFHHLI
jgi:hypothetical protein